MDGRIATLRQGSLNEAQRSYAPELCAAEAAFNDASFRALLAGMAQCGELANTLVGFVSDHGEEFWEYGERRGHGVSPSEQATHLPLIVAGPGVEAGDAVRYPVPLPTAQPWIVRATFVRDHGIVDRHRQPGVDPAAADLIYAGTAPPPATEPRQR